MTTSKRRLLTPGSTAAVAAALVLAVSGTVAGGCAKNDASGGGAQVSAEQQIQKIQNNPNMPAFAKEQAIRSIRAGQSQEKAGNPSPAGTK